jgi:uncharacterized protein YodC (DUF2158 family)
MLKNGDIVRLASGGPNMTVCMFHADAPYVCCQWFNGAELKTDNFDPPELVIVAIGPDVTVVAKQMQRLNKLDADLRAFAAKPDHPDQIFSMGAEEARLLVAEIDRLRGIAGAVSQGPSFTEIRGAISGPIGSNGSLFHPVTTEH